MAYRKKVLKDGWWYYIEKTYGQIKIVTCEMSKDQGLAVGISIKEKHGSMLDKRVLSAKKVLVVGQKGDVKR